jgi:hypothetical protein
MKKPSHAQERGLGQVTTKTKAAEASNSDRRPPAQPPLKKITQPWRSGGARHRTKGERVRR